MSVQSDGMLGESISTLFVQLLIIMKVLRNVMTLRNTTKYAFIQALEACIFSNYWQQHQIRSKFVSVLRERFADYPLSYAIGGQISFDVFPTGWDKTYCLRHIEPEGFEEIHFFGDKTYEVGCIEENLSEP